MLHVLGGPDTFAITVFFSRTVCMLPLQTSLSLGQDTPFRYALRPNLYAQYSFLVVERSKQSKWATKGLELTYVYFVEMSGKYSPKFANETSMYFPLWKQSTHLPRCRRSSSAVERGNDDLLRSYSKLVCNEGREDKKNYRTPGIFLNANLLKPFPPKGRVSYKEN